MTVFSVTTIFVSICIVGFALAARPGDPNFSCTPGQTFQEDCNSCTCLADGKNAACTLKACIYKRQAAPNTPGFQCNPGQRFQYECNDCTCSANGRNAACTFKLCSRKRRANPAPNTPGFRCTPNEPFKYECNNCNCAADGISASCSFAACPPGTYKKRRQAVCQNGDTMKQDCNDCRCIKGNWACTRKSCPVFKRDIEDEKNCKSGEVIQRECNSCTCISGKGFACTRKECPKITKREPELTVTNTEVTVLRRNRIGSKVGFIDYIEEPVETEFNGTSCAPNDKFTIDCNTCYCNNDGSGYSCTEKLCASSTQT